MSYALEYPLERQWRVGSIAHSDLAEIKLFWHLFFNEPRNFGTRSLSRHIEDGLIAWLWEHGVEA